MIWRHVMAVIAAILLTSCGSHSIQAPVGDRSKARKPVTGFHLVKPGDSLYSIAWQYSLNINDLASWNQISSPYTIYAKQRLRLSSPPKKAQEKNKSIPATSPGASQKPSQVKQIKSKLPAKVKVITEQKKPAPKKEPSIAQALNSNQKVIWEWPVKGVTKTAGEASSVKKGIRIFGKSGEPVRAAAAGKVVYAGSGLTGYGKLIIIKHNREYLSAYAHNRKLLAKEGALIKSGQKVALMGHSGVNRNQLYFEIRKNGSPVDPLKYLPKR